MTLQLQEFWGVRGKADLKDVLIKLFGVHSNLASPEMLSAATQLFMVYTWMKYMVIFNFMIGLLKFLIPHENRKATGQSQKQNSSWLIKKLALMMRSGIASLCEKFSSAKNIA